MPYALMPYIMKICLKKQCLVAMEQHKEAYMQVVAFIWALENQP